MTRKKVARQATGDPEDHSVRHEVFREIAQGGAASSHLTILRDVRGSVPNGDEPPLSRPSVVRPVTHIRSTLLMTSQRTLREEGLFESYLAQLPAQVRDEIGQLGAPSWLPIELGCAHYRACDRLGLSAAQVAEIAQRVAMVGEGSFLGIAMKLVRGVGVTPWSILPQAPRLWSRGFQGGAMTWMPIGPKEARIDVVGWPCASIPYCRDALRGLTGGVLKLMCQQIYVREVPVTDPSQQISLRLSWA